MSPGEAARRYRQQIPRPREAIRHEEPLARFARLSPAELAHLVSFAHIEAAFSPSATAAVFPRPVEAAVLLPLLSETEAAVVPEARLEPPGARPRGGARLALIRRATHLRANPGDVAFPGGRIEPGEDPAAAALREAEEEVELDRFSVRLLGALPSVERVSRPGPIAPYVGAVERGARLRANPTEVDQILLVPLAELADPARYWEETWSGPDGSGRRMSFFDYGEDLIWGASARILVSLFEHLVAAE